MEKNWDSVRKQYAGIIQNLINNIDICNRRFVEQGDSGYLVQREVYIKEVEEIKTFIVNKEKELGCYGDEHNED